MVAADEIITSPEEPVPAVIQQVKDVKPKVIFTLEIYKIVRDARQQHGLRHEDYQRYRGYCTRRIKRLRKALHLPQGDKRHFKKRDVTDQHLKDEKYLYIPLMLAERAWGYAMQLRQESNTEPRKRFHLIARLRKATAYAAQLQTLCEAEVCDARTKLEAQAYLSWLVGTLHFELKLWESAIKNLKEAQIVYENLIPLLNEDDAAIYSQRIEELTPSIRYCAYNIGDTTVLDELMQLRSVNRDLLSSIDHLMFQTKERQAEVLSEVTWRGRTVGIRPEKIRVFLLADRNLVISKTKSIDENVSILESHLIDCKDSIQAVKDEIKTDPTSKNRTQGSGLSSLQFLLSYLMHIRLERTIERNLLLAQQAKENLQKSGNAQGTDVKSKTRPQDLVRLYEIILQNLVEQQQLPGLEDDQEYQENVETRIKTYKAFRCFYIAQCLGSLKRWRDCVALYTLSAQYADEALLLTKDEDVKQLHKDIDSMKFSALANSVLESDNNPELIQSKTNFKLKKVPLSERLDEYYEDVNIAKNGGNIIKLPPDMEPVPCKALFFDLAQNHLEYPNLEDKLDVKNKSNIGPGGQPAGISGFVKGLWGWGGQKK